ncbi:MAG: hypothetical protein QNJ45_05185 [Ardenticatenaceae bacterium]|nr:hypothetical protein [Ardenticatenaceae bacterium]
MDAKKGKNRIWAAACLLAALFLLVACQPEPDPIVVVPTTAPGLADTVTVEPDPTVELATQTPVEQPSAVPPTTSAGGETVTQTPVEQPTITPAPTEIPPTPSTAPAGVDTAVQFQPGTTGAVITGGVIPGVFDKYRLVAQAEQLMTVELVSTNPNATFTLIAPSGGAPLVYADAGFLPTNFEGVLPESGEYLIEIYSTVDAADYELRVEIKTLADPSDMASSGYRLMETQVIGDYQAEIWAKTDNEGALFIGESIGLLKQGETVVAQVDYAKSFDPLSGTDINGTGTPDILFEGYTGGAHCCFSLDIFDLGTTAVNVLSLDSGNCGANPVDLDDDGIYEIATCDDSFAYRYCAYAGSPAVASYLTFLDGRYQAAAPNDLSLYTEQIEQMTTWLDQSEGEPFGWDNTNKCEVLGLSLIYLYTGRPAEGLQVLETYYNGSDLPFFWADILKVINGSELYVPAGDFPDAGFPDYYQMTHASTCGETRNDVIFTTSGQDRCDASAARQPLFWLSDRLTGPPIISLDETLQAVPDGCTTECRFDIVSFSMSGEVVHGELRFINEDGSPTAIQRFNLEGQPVSEKWSLRGDLSWEQR